MNEETTDLEYREAAMRMACEYFKVRMERPRTDDVLAVAKTFENYLRTGERHPG